MLRSDSESSARIASPIRIPSTRRSTNALVQYRGLYCRAAIHHRKQLAQSGSRARHIRRPTSWSGRPSRSPSDGPTEFRAEAFNVTNTPPLGQPNGSFGSAAFGTITTALDPRVFEFVLKVQFSRTAHRTPISTLPLQTKQILLDRRRRRGRALLLAEPAHDLASFAASSARPACDNARLNCT